MQKCSTGSATKRIELLVRLVRWLLNGELFQSDVARHGLKGLKELGIKTGSMLICIKIGFEKTIMQRS